MKKTFFTLVLAGLMVGCASQSKEEFYEKRLVFPPDATLEINSAMQVAQDFRKVFRKNLEIL